MNHLDYIEIAKEYFPVTAKTAILPIKRSRVIIPRLDSDWFTKDKEWELLILSKYRSNKLLNTWYRFLRWVGNTSGIEKIERMGQFGVWVEKTQIFGKIIIDTHQQLDANGQPFMGYDKDSDILAVYEPESYESMETQSQSLSPTR